MVARANVGGGKEGGVTANRGEISCREFSCCDENVLQLIVVAVAQFCEYTKNHWIVYFKWVN